jgi:hypothetical protein
MAAMSFTVNNAQLGAVNNLSPAELHPTPETITYTGRITTRGGAHSMLMGVGA